MKILHISKYYHPFRGGIEKFIKELSEGMCERGHEVRVLCSSETTKKQIENIGRVEVIRMPRWGTLFSQPLTFSLPWEIHQHLQWADVIHMHTPNPLAELVFSLKNIEKPSLLTYHCDVVRQKRLMKIYGPVAQNALAKANHVVVSTPNHLKFSAPLKNHQDRSQVIPFGTTEKFTENSMTLSHRVQKFKKHYGDFFLFIGRMVPYKGVNVLLKAMTQVEKQLVLIGEGPRKLQWIQQAKDLGVDKRVHFLGKVADDLDFAAYIRGCLSLVLPSVDESEAFGIVLIEAMAHGRPVITTRLKSGVSWVNAPGVTGLEVLPKDWAGLAAAMNTMGFNNDLRTQLGEGALERFHKNFRLENMVASYEEAYMVACGLDQKVAA